jgi:cyclohexa-1,5-dienecarbonyl-CoA hydratase
MSYQLINVREKENGAVTEITLCNSPGNILSMAMMKEIAQQIEIDENNPHKKIIIFGAEGKNFSFGASVEEHTQDKINQMLPYFHSFLARIIKCPVPTMAKVSGLCLGGAFEMALACTFVCADESARFGFPEIILGVFPPAACVLLPARIGEAPAARMILTGDRVKAGVLQESGLLALLVENGNLDRAVDAYFQKHFHPKSASSLCIAHKASRMQLADLYGKYIGKAESMYLKDLMKTNDANEGIRAFIEKRPPKWRDA